MRLTEAKSWLKKGVRRFWLKQFRSTTDCDLFIFINHFFLCVCVFFVFVLFVCLFVVVVVVVVFLGGYFLAFCL